MGHQSNLNIAIGGSSQDSNVYDKLRLLNGGQPWSTHGSAWYVPSPVSASAAAAAAIGVAFSQHGPISPSQYNNLNHSFHDPLNENHQNIHGHLQHHHHNQHYHSNSNEMKLDLNGNEFKKGNF